MTEILIKIAAALALLAGLFFGEQYIEGLGYSRAKAEYEGAISDQEMKDATLLATETDKARAAESALQAVKNKQELQDAANQKTVAGLSARLRDLAGPAGRLRDPNASGCGGVVVAPKVQLPAPPVIVQTTTPKPAGYFQRSLADYFSNSGAKPTTSMTLTPAAAPTPLQ